MMERQRADIGFADDLDGFDPSEWTPEPRPKPVRTQTQAVAEATGFRSREAMPAKAAGQGTAAAAEAPKPVRRRRTGRNAQFNLKAKPETIERFCAIADAQGWGLGETLEYAVALLEREYAQSGTQTASPP